MKRAIFWKLFSAMLLVIALVFAAGIFAVHQNTDALMSERLSAETRLVSHLLPDTAQIASLADVIDEREFRITLIETNGDVLYESGLFGVPEENHLTREEVISALAGEPQTVNRYSETLQCQMTYYAELLTLRSGEQIVIRLAVKSSETSGYLFVALPFLVLAMLLSLSISALIAKRISRSVSERFYKISESLQSLNADKYCPLATSSKEPEIYSVLCQINELSEKTHYYIGAMTKEAEKFSAVLENIDEGIVALNDSGHIIFANNRAIEIFGGSSEEQKSLMYLVPSMTLCEKVLCVKGSERFDYANDGRDYLVTVTKLEKDTQTSGISRIMAISDITNEKAIAREKSEFFANASHELKTPITVMQGSAELLLTKGTLGNTEKARVERIHKESLRLGELISDMLKLSNLERREEDMIETAVSVRDTAQDVFSELSPLFAEKHISARIVGNGTLYIDPKKLYELIGNLVSNAVRYNKDGGQVSVEIEQTQEGLRLTVRDTGIGIAPEHIPRLCERFYRVDKSRSKKTGGTGLGLAIVKHIAARYGAKMTIESTLGVGTAVKITFANRT